MPIFQYNNKKWLFCGIFFGPRTPLGRYLEKNDAIDNNIVIFKTEQNYQ